MTVPAYEVPAEMREFAERSVEQARKAFEGFVGAAQKAAGSLEGTTSTLSTGVKDLGSKAMSYGEANVKAAFDHAQKLVKAKDLQEVMQLQTEFVKSQMATLQEQAKDIGAAVQKAAAPKA